MQKKSNKKHPINIQSFIWIFICIISWNYIYSQKNPIDSLVTTIKIEKNDSIKILNLTKLSKLFWYNNIDTAIIIGEEALRLSEKTNCLSCRAACYHNLAVCHAVRENFKLSLSNLVKSIQINLAIKNKVGLSKNYNMLGIIYSSEHYDSLALENYNIALGYAIETTDSSQLSRILGNIGSIYESWNRIDEAKPYYERALLISSRHKDKTNTSTNLDYLGNVYFKKNDYINALNYYQKAIDLAIEVNDNENISNTSLSLAKLFLIEKNYTQSIHYAKLSLQCAQKINYLSNIQKSANFLYDFYYKKKDFETAINYLITSNQAKDSLSNSTNEKQFRLLQQKYEMDKKQKQILILAKDKELAENIAQNQIIYTLFFAIGFLLLVVLAFFIFRSYRKELNAKELLTLQKAEILEKNEELRSLNEEITVQRDLLATQRKNTTDSIRYARRIQNAMLPPADVYKNYFPDSFIYNRPKDIVSGDFYWFKNQTICINDEKQEMIYFALADCTGHGVPGAFMSILCYNIIDLAAEENTGVSTNKLLTLILDMISKKLRQHSEDSQINDGLDIALCTYNKSTKILSYSGLKNPVFIVRNKEMFELKPERKSLILENELIQYKVQELKLEKFDIIYLFSDGYSDQFDSLNKNKFSMRRFKELLIDISDLTNKEQTEKIHKTYEDWKGINEQIDDVMILGIRI